MIPLIIEPAELAPLLEKEDMLIVDLSSNETWVQAHLPGAVHVAPAELISGERPAVGKLAPVARLNALFSRLGYRPGQHIVAYDDEGGGWAGRFLWTLDVIGHTGGMSYLNGGIRAWVAESLPITQQIVEPSPTDVTVTVDQAYIATLPQILDTLGDKETVVWDARSPQEWAGTKVVSARGGHIPGAINLDWLEVMDHDRNLRIREDIAEVLNERGITRDKRVITHCQSHHRSGLAYIVGKSLGYNIQAYDGSWSEWGNDPDTPVETA